MEKYYKILKTKINKNIIMISVTTICLLIMVLLSNQFIAKATEQNNEKEKNNVNIIQEIEKYFKLENGQILLQEKIDIELEKEKNKEYEHLKVKAPKIQNQFPKLAIVIVNGVKLESNFFGYNFENGETEINLNKSEGLNNKKETYKIIYGYDSIDVDKKGKVILDSESVIKLENEEKELKISKREEKELKKVGQNISITGEMDKEIYKGYMYEGYTKETEFQEEYNIEISNMQGLEEVYIRKEKENYIQEKRKIDTKIKEEIIATIEKNTNESIYYKSTKINKNNMLRILGDSGKISIKDKEGNILFLIDKETPNNEQGNIEVFYNNHEIKDIEIITTKPVEEGELKIINKRSILPDTQYKKEELKEFSKLKQTIVSNNNKYDMEMNLLDTITQADLNINKTEISTMIENQEIEIKTILKSNKNTMELYENPTIKITLPEQVDEIKLKEEAKILYDEEIKIKNIDIKRNTVIIELVGKQTRYKEKAIEGAVIDLKLNLKVNKKATNTKENVNVNILNAKEEIEVNKDINIVSPKEIITMNNIEELGVETFGNEHNSVVNINRNDKAKEISINSQIINNNENGIYNVRIIGEMPTNGSRQIKKAERENNLGAILKSNIETDGINGKIYYTSNSKANEKIEDPNNGWKEKIEDVENVEKYMYTIDEMKQNQKVVINYKLKIPENLDYDKQAIEGYKVIYNNKETNIENTIESTYITLTTGQGPIIEGKLEGFVGRDNINEKSKIKAGEEISYNVKLKNIGSEDSGSVKLNFEIPKELKYKEDEEKRILEVQINNIKSEQETIIKINLLVDEKLSKETNIESKIKINYKNVQKETNTIKYKVFPSEIIGKIEMATTSEATFIEGDIIEYRAVINNISNSKLEDIKVKWSIPGFCKINSQSILGSSNLPEKTFGADEVMVIKSLDAKESVKVSLHVDIEEVKNGIEKIFVSAILEQGTNIYRIPGTKEKDVYSMNNFEIVMKANNENGFVKPGDEILYKIEITNKNKINLKQLIEDKIPDELKIEEIKIDGQEPQKDEIHETEHNYIYVNTEFDPDQTKVITIRTIVNKKESATEDEKISNQAIITTNKMKRIESNKIIHIISRKEDNESDNNNGNNNKTYKVNGFAWKDINQNGEMENNEERLKGIEVFLINIKNNKIEVDDNGNEIKAITEENGEYILSDIPEGEYIVVFKYDNTRYKITKYKAEGIDETKMSKAISKKMTLRGEEDIFGVTDKINISDNISNINIGVIETERFDFKLDKYIKKVIVENSKGKNIYNYNNTQLAKVEIDAKEINRSKITIEYNIVISNQGEVGGYIKNIVDYIPKEFDFNPKNNKGWYQKNGNLYNESLKNEKLNSGESRLLTLTLEKNMNENAIDTYVNTAEIAESYNELGIQDINSKEANRKQGENDLSTASIIIAIKTGKIIIYITLIILCVLIIGIGIIFIKKKVLNKK